MSIEEYESWVLFRRKYGPLTLHMRVDRAGAIAAQAYRGGKLDSYMPWGKEIKADDVPAHVKQGSEAITEYTDAQLDKIGLYRDESGKIKRKVSNAGKRVIGGKMYDPKDPNFQARVEAAQKMQDILKARDKKPGPPIDIRTLER